MIDKESHARLKGINLKIASESTLDYLENYLSPDRFWGRRITLQQRINQIRHAQVDWEIVSRYIKNMEYRDFLKTPYWKAIADHTKYKAGYRCQLCNCTYDLVTHHRSYDIHGREHAYMNELIVLCDNCHSRFHDKLPKVELESQASLKVLILMVVAVFFIFIFSNGLAGDKAVNRSQNRDRRR